jgi:glycerate 2-kinase
VKGSGRGGRNQELALAFALASQSSCSQNSWVFLSGSTDGIDGPTDAAGGIVDEGTLPRIFSAGFEPMELLTNNDSYHALHLADDLLFTGTTGTNVADLQILLISPT